MNNFRKFVFSLFNECCFILILLFFMIQNSYPIDQTYLFNAKDCLLLNYEYSFDHKIYPLGLFHKRLKVSKKECTLHFEYNAFNVYSKKWSIDICKDPIHIKLIGSGVKILKRNNFCFSGEWEFFPSYCSELAELNSVIEDEGIIFANGSKDDLKSEYGALFCSSLLLKRYFTDQIVFNKSNDWTPISIEKQLFLSKCEIDSGSTIKVSPQKNNLPPSQVKESLSSSHGNPEVTVPKLIKHDQIRLEKNLWDLIF